MSCFLLGGWYDSVRWQACQDTRRRQRWGTGRSAHLVLVLRCLKSNVMQTLLASSLTSCGLLQTCLGLSANVWGRTPLARCGRMCSLCTTMQTVTTSCSHSMYDFAPCDMLPTRAPTCCPLGDGGPPQLRRGHGSLDRPARDQVRTCADPHAPSSRDLACREFLESSGLSCWVPQEHPDATPDVVVCRCSVL